MDRNLSSWFSPSLQKEMPVAVYGHYGFALLLIPTAAADYLEYERFQLMDSIKPFIESGKVKVFSVDSINNESWMNDSMEPRHKAIRHQQWNNYIFNEVIPFIRTHTSAETSIITSGASFGALHSANLFFKRPDLINGCLAMSGVYDLTEYTKGYFDEDVYFNSPCHYLPNLSDHGVLEQIRKSHHIHILSGSGAYEDPDAARRLAGILYNKGITYELDIWGADMTHDWPTWRTMLPHYLATRF
ncbi:esterase family protein [Flavihumibacter profundi]|jgi:esterase/lipase superfamily enzyme|uniref:esterase family protein n=1 Tax=Flavihumibacter profundi TaxID=2716883 RepID=UPI001CC68081|nr:alpha/beta hydrolase-fold protein [Flavihumibacter profundi]MBZ5856352.1 esterase [Flavihumibacter profundi]